MVDCNEVRRVEILNGELSFPEQIRSIVNPKQKIDLDVFINEFWANIWHNFLKEKSSDVILWMTKSNNPKKFNQLLMLLSKGGWITSDVDGLYAYVMLNNTKLLKWVSKEELTNVKFRYKFIKYRLQDTMSILCDTVQSNGKHIKTGLVRKGFMKAGNHKFKYDTKYILLYINSIAQNVKKGLRNSTKDITYQEIIDELLNYYSIDGTEYTLGNCYIDSRGRAIFNCSKKVFNPVSCKDARALLICKPQKLTLQGTYDVYATISELLDYRGINYDDKVTYGEQAYNIEKLPDYNEMCKTGDYSDLHKLIWLQRIYENLNNYDEDKGILWTVPIERDATASMVQLIAVLTNDYEYMKKTNLVENEEGFQDIWTVPYVSRTHVKKAMTPQLYGSGKHTRELWDANKLTYTQVQLNQMSHDITNGIYSNANNFKNFIINNVQPKTTMKVKIQDEIFEIECNRFKWEVTKQVHYSVYTSPQGLLKKVTKAVNLVPDINQFKRYFVTLLIHNLDSQICNTICKEAEWVLPNHDSFTIHPNDAHDICNIYTNIMHHIWINRKSILKEYLQSIGITQEYKEQESSITINGFSPYCLK